MKISVTNKSYPVLSRPGNADASISWKITTGCLRRRNGCYFVLLKTLDNLQEYTFFKTVRLVPCGQLFQKQICPKTEKRFKKWPFASRKVYPFTLRPFFATNVVASRASMGICWNLFTLEYHLFYLGHLLPKQTDKTMQIQTLLSSARFQVSIHVTDSGFHRRLRSSQDFPNFWMPWHARTPNAQIICIYARSCQSFLYILCIHEKAMAG